MMKLLTPDKRHSGSATKGMRGSLGGSVIGEEFAPKPIIETEEQRADREKKEFKDSFKVLSKEESVQEMKKKEFDDFLMKTGRIMERALDNDVDIVGDFFADDDEEAALMIK